MYCHKGIGIDVGKTCFQSIVIGIFTSIVNVPVDHNKVKQRKRESV